MVTVRIDKTEEKGTKDDKGWLGRYFPTGLAVCRAKDPWCPTVHAEIVLMQTDHEYRKSTCGGNHVGRSHI